VMGVFLLNTDFWTKKKNEKEKSYKIIRM